jgi:hypothetical protein
LGIIVEVGIPKTAAIVVVTIIKLLVDLIIDPISVREEHQFSLKETTHSSIGKMDIPLIFSFSK